MDQSVDTLEAVDGLGGVDLLFKLFRIHEVLLAHDLGVINLYFFNLLPFLVEHLVIPLTLVRDIIRREEVLALLR